MIYSPSCTTIGYNNCCGCGACEAICPVNAVSMAPNLEGFLYPAIEKNKCIECNKCIDVCPIIHNVRKMEEDALNRSFLFRSNYVDYQKESSSGAFFYVFARRFIEEGGYVCGVVWDKSYSRAYYVCSNSLEDVERMRKSKYVQSEKGGVFWEVKDKLDNGYRVLFSGCGCDIAALYSYLGGDYKELYTLEVICHGPTSSKYLKEWNEYISGKYKSPIKSLEMRSKKEYGDAFPFVFRIEFENGRIFKRNFFNTEMGYFFSNIQRMSCYYCRFKCKRSHVGDYLIGDAQSKLKDLECYDRSGTSVVIINTEKGKESYETLQNITSVEINYTKVVESIPRIVSSWEYTNMRDLLAKREQRYGLIEAVRITVGIVKALRFCLPECIVKMYDSLKSRKHDYSERKTR